MLLVAPTMSSGQLTVFVLPFAITWRGLPAHDRRRWLVLCAAFPCLFLLAGWANSPVPALGLNG
jgi:hypothetical protein